MPPKQITRQRIFRLLIAGFGMVILMLAAAAIVGIRNIEHIQAISKDLLREQSVSRGLIDELQSQQTSLSEVFSVLARDPDSVDYARIMDPVTQRKVQSTYAEYSRVRGERFGKNLPASAAVQVAGLLQGALIEIDAVAFIPE